MLFLIDRGLILCKPKLDKGLAKCLNKIMQGPGEPQPSNDPQPQAGRPVPINPAAGGEPIRPGINGMPRGDFGNKIDASEPGSREQQGLIDAASNKIKAGQAELSDILLGNVPTFTTEHLQHVVDFWIDQGVVKVNHQPTPQGKGGEFGPKKAIAQLVEESQRRDAGEQPKLSDSQVEDLRAELHDTGVIQTASSTQPASPTSTP